MTLSGDEFLRLESLIYRPVSARPDWLKAWRNEAGAKTLLVEAGRLGSLSVIVAREHKQHNER